MIPDHISQMEPMLPSEAEPELLDRAFDLVQQSSALAAPLSMPVQEELSRLVPSMNCYYSNFIEGHQTQPRGIERALARDFDGNDRQRDLQQEAVAHIEVQSAIDSRNGAPNEWPSSEVYLRWLHREFCKRLPDRLL